MQHPNARLTPRGRRELVRLVEQGATLREAAAACGVAASTACVWTRRWRAARSSIRPRWRACATAPADPHRVRDAARRVSSSICAARLETGWGPRLIAGVTGVPHQTVWKVLQRAGCSRRPKPPREAANRYEWPCPGDLLHMDTRYARFTRPGHALTGDRSSTSAEKRQRVGYEYAHAIVDDHSRPGLRRAAPRRARRHRRRLRPARACLVRRPRHHRPAPDDRQRLGLHPLRPWPTCSPITACDTSQSPRRRPRPTARSSASTRPWPANGPTASPTAHATTAPEACHTGSTTTTSNAPTAQSATGHPSAAFTQRLEAGQLAGVPLSWSAPMPRVRQLPRGPVSR